MSSTTVPFFSTDKQYKKTIIKTNLKTTGAKTVTSCSTAINFTIFSCLSSFMTLNSRCLATSSRGLTSLRNTLHATRSPRRCSHRQIQILLRFTSQHVHHSVRVHVMHSALISLRSKPITAASSSSSSSSSTYTFSAFYRAMLCIARTMLWQDVCLLRHTSVLYQNGLSISSNFFQHWVDTPL